MVIDAGLTNPGGVSLTSVTDDSDDGGVSDVEVVDSDVANDPSTLEEDDRVVASRDDEGNLHTGFVDDDSDSGVTNSNVDPFDAVVLEPGDDGEQFERADDQSLPTVEQSDDSGSSGSSGSGSGSSSSSGSESGSTGSSSGSGGGQGGSQSGIGPAVMPAGWSPDSGDGDGLDTQTMLMIGGLAVAGIGIAFVAGGDS